MPVISKELQDEIMRFEVGASSNEETLLLFRKLYEQKLLLHFSKKYLTIASNYEALGLLAFSPDNSSSN